MPLGIATAGVGLGAAGLLPTYTLAWVAIGISGLGVAAFHPEAARYANYVSGDRRATGMSVFSVGGNLGFALGPFLTTPVLLLAGLGGGWALALPGVAMAAALLLALGRLRRSAPPRRVENLGPQGPAAEPRHPDRWGPFSRLTGALLCRSIVFYGLNTFIPLYWIGVLGQSKAVGGLALTLLLVCGSIGTLLGGRLGDRFPRRTVVLLATAATGPLLLALALTPAPPLATAMLVPLALAMYLPISLMVVLGQEYLPNQPGDGIGGHARAVGERGRDGDPLPGRDRRPRRAQDRAPAAGRAAGAGDRAGGHPAQGGHVAGHGLRFPHLPHWPPLISVSLRGRTGILQIAGMANMAP
jgi:FSR family fosmidomycin resistance protein-like MFS transporter